MGLHCLSHARGGKDIQHQLWIPSLRGTVFPRRPKLAFTTPYACNHLCGILSLEIGTISMCLTVPNSDFKRALRLMDENLRRLCTCQGENPDSNLDTLQLLHLCLRATHIGCISSPVSSPPITYRQPPSSLAGPVTCPVQDGVGSVRSCGRTRACSDSVLQQQPTRDFGV